MIGAGIVEQECKDQDVWFGLIEEASSNLMTAAPSREIGRFGLPKQELLDRAKLAGGRLK